jgi:hypothetical protein
MPRPSRATAHHLVEKCADRDACSHPARAGSFIGAQLTLSESRLSDGFAPKADNDREL